MTRPQINQRATLIILSFGSRDEVHLKFDRLGVATCKDMYECILRYVEIKNLKRVDQEILLGLSYSSKPVWKAITVDVFGGLAYG